MADEKILESILKSGKQLIKLNFTSRPFSLLSSYIRAILRKTLAEVVICKFPESARRYLQVTDKKYIYVNFPDRPEQVVVFIDIVILLEMFHVSNILCLPFKELLFCKKDSDLIVEVFKSDDLYRSLFNYQAFLNIELSDFNNLLNFVNKTSKCSDAEKNNFKACMINFYNHLTASMFDKICTFSYYVTARKLSTQPCDPLFEKSDIITFFNPLALQGFINNYVDMNRQTTITYHLQIYTNSKPLRQPFLKLVGVDDEDYNLIELKGDSAARCINQVFKSKETITKHNSFFIYCKESSIIGNKLGTERLDKVYTMYDCFHNTMNNIPEEIKKEVIRLSSFMGDIF